MSSPMPKEQQTAFQRWEMTSFGDKRSAQLELASATGKTNLAELNAIKEQARNEAYAIGYKDAYELGYQDGRVQGYEEMQAQAVEVLDTLSQLKENFEQQLANAHHDIGEDLLKLAIDLASAMTKTEFDVHPEAILPVVHEAIELLPSIHQPAHLVLHPDDALIIKELMGDRLERESWRIINDPTLTRGGCRIETAQNLIDATYETRWSRLSDALTGSQQTRIS